MPGSVVTCLLEGTRPLLVEIQALVNKTSFGYPVRKASGFDLNRLHVLTAVLQKRAGLNLAHMIFINVVGGITADEPRLIWQSASPSPALTKTKSSELIWLSSEKSDWEAKSAELRKLKKELKNVRNWG